LGGYGVFAISCLVSAGKTSPKKELPLVALFGRVLLGFELQQATASPPTARPQ